MSFRSYSGVAAATGGLSLTGALAWAAWYEKVRSRRAALDKEYADILAETSAIDEARLESAEVLRKKQRDASLLKEALDTLWGDRLERYRQTGKEVHSYLKALPEALGVLKGITNHYQYMTREMPRFIGFDVACSKVHNFALLLQYGEKVGIHNVSETIRQLLIAEPLVRVVCDSLVDENLNISCPSSISESSSTFCFCMEGLDRAVESAIANYVERNKSKVMKNPSNVFCQALRKVLGKMELMMLTNDEIAIEEEREALRHYIIRNKRQLHTTEDLLSAMQYVKGISNRFGSTGGGAEGVEAAVLSDPKVISAQEQLLLWRHAAAIFLVRQQAKDALNSYHLLLAETLTKVRRS